MKYQIAYQTDVGIRKDTNQDSCCVMEAQTERGTVLFAAVCDGMGGLAKGELASATLIRALASWFEAELPCALAADDARQEVRYQWDRLIKEQNQKIAAYGRSLHLQLGTTISALLIMEDGQFLIGHVGDSRVYRIRNGEFTVLTSDQTLVAREMQLGHLTLEEAERDPRRSVLLQCVGASRVVEPAFYSGQAAAGECFMLCSDGFRRVIRGEEICRAFAPENNQTEEAMKANIQELVELNKFRHETDNITAVLIHAVQEV